ncbi:hypothetical protein Tco_0077268 [Tanacetum coccineum]
MTSAVVIPNGSEIDIVARPQLTTPLNPTSNVISSSQTYFVTLVHPDTQVVNKAFVMANYSRLKPVMRRRMRELRLQEIERQRRMMSPRESPVDYRNLIWSPSPKPTVLHNRRRRASISRRLKVPPYVGYYDRKGDQQNFIDVFEGAMRMEKWPMIVTCHMFVYILKDVTRVRWNNLPKGVVTNYEDSKRRFRTHFKQQKKQNKTHLAITRLNEDQRIAGFVHEVKIKSLVKFISTELPESYDGLMEKIYSWLQAEETAYDGKPITFMDSGMGDKTQKGRPWKGSEKKNRDKRDSEKVGKTFTKPPKMVSKTRDTSKYYEFHQDYGHDTYACRELKNETKEVVKSGKWVHLIKGIRKGRAKRQVGRVLLDEGAACDIIYEHCFLKLRKEVRERRKDVYTTLLGFSGELVSPLGEISLRITIGEAPHHRTD